MSWPSLFRTVRAWVHRKLRGTDAAKGFAPFAVANAPPPTAAAGCPSAGGGQRTAVAACSKNKAALRPRNASPASSAPPCVQPDWLRARLSALPCSGAQESAGSRAVVHRPRCRQRPRFGVKAAHARLRKVAVGVPVRWRAGSTAVATLPRMRTRRPRCLGRPCSGAGAPPGSAVKAAGCLPGSLPYKREGTVGLAQSGARGQHSGLTPRSRGDPPRQAALGRQQPRHVYCLLPAQGVLPRRSPQLER